LLELHFASLFLSRRPPPPASFEKIQNIRQHQTKQIDEVVAVAFPAIH
jgi:hypothetical protein